MQATLKPSAVQALRGIISHQVPHQISVPSLQVQAGLPPTVKFSEGNPFRKSVRISSKSASSAQQQPIKTSMAIILLKLTRHVMPG